MTFRTILITSAAVLGLVSAAAIAHPSKTDADELAGAAKNKSTKTITLDGIGPLKGRIKIEDFDFDFEDLSKEFLESFEDLEGLEGLEKLADITGFDVKTIKGKDGETTITIKSGKGGMLSDILTDMEFSFDDEGSAKKLRNHFKSSKHKHGHSQDNVAHPRMIIKNMLKKYSKKDSKDVQVWVQDNGGSDGGFPHNIDLNDGMQISIKKGGDVNILKGGKKLSSSRRHGRSVNVDKNITTENGKRKTRIVIEIEEPAE